MAQTKEERILSFDQSSMLSGYSVFKGEELQSYGVLNLKDIDSKKNGDTYYDERVDNVEEFMIRCIDFFKPTVIIVEDIQQQSNVQTFKDLAYLQGVLKHYLYKNKFPYGVLPPGGWRKELGIKGRKREDQKANAIAYVKDKFGLDVTEDEADAICIGEASKKLLKRKKLNIRLSL